MNTLGGAINCIEYDHNYTHTPADTCAVAVKAGKILNLLDNLIVLLILFKARIWNAVTSTKTYLFPLRRVF